MVISRDGLLLMLSVLKLSNRIGGSNPARPLHIWQARPHFFPAPSPAIPWIINSGTGVTWCDDTIVEAGTAYNYYAIASNQKGESDVSAVAATRSSHANINEQ